MQISLSGYQNSLFYLDVQRAAARKPGVSPAAPAETFKPSSLTLLAASSSFSEVSIQDQSLTLAYRRGGTAMRIQSTLDVNLRTRDVSLDVILPAELLDVELPDGLFQDGPLQFNLQYRLETAEVSRETQAQIIRPTRKAEDILMDLSQAIVQVLRRRGDKSLQVLFDEEAIQALFADAGVKRVMNEIAGLITVINAMVLEGGPRQRYTIEISGKGRPYLDVQQRTQVQAETTNLRLNLIILPPEARQQAEASAPAEVPAPAAAS